MPHYTESPSWLSKNRHPLRITPKVVDVLLNPLQCKLLILQSMVSCATRFMLTLQGVQGHKSQCTKAIVQSDDDDIMSFAVFIFPLESHPYLWKRSHKIKHIFSRIDVSPTKTDMYHVGIRGVHLFFAFNQSGFRVGILVIKWQVSDWHSDVAHHKVPSHNCFPRKSHPRRRRPWPAS